MSYQYRPVVLLILDGWGVAPDTQGNAVTRARLPHFLNYIKHYPVMTLHASGVEVGLTFGEMGNSEVGHLNLGAGRVYYQTLPRINQDILNGNFFKNQSFIDAVDQAKKNRSKLHLIGLVSSGNVHASKDHLYALLELCQKEGLSNQVFVHVILDGRDSPYNSGEVFVKELQRDLKKMKIGKIASLSGRYYAMDRDNRWDRTEKAYRAIVEGKAERTAEDPLKAVQESYAEENFDEEFVPTVMVKNNKPLGVIQEKDAAIFFNFRPDRARQLTQACVLPGFSKFERPYFKNLFFVTMTEYDKDLPAVVAYPSRVIHNCLAEVVSKAGKKQLHVGETEKYAHVTYFLNGTVEEPFLGEDRILIPSPRVSMLALS
jgi:2,3-bisphosphoglycerate-independent phosphoglycerate mutase